jgi:hypothetical protein
LLFSACITNLLLLLLLLLLMLMLLLLTPTGGAAAAACSQDRGSQCKEWRGPGQGVCRMQSSALPVGAEL